MFINFLNKLSKFSNKKCDQGTNFESHMIDELCKVFGIDKRRTTPFHPQCDGMVERYKRTLVDMLAMYVADNQKDWDYWLPQITFAYRCSKHSTTGLKPFEVMYGRKPVLPVDLQYAENEKDEDNTYESIKKKLEEIKEKVYKRTQAAQKSQKKQYEKRLVFKPYNVNERVWLFNPVNKPGLSPKLAMKWYGPFTIVEKLSDITYKLIHDNQKTQRTVHFNRLKKCYTPAPNQIKSAEKVVSFAEQEPQFTAPLEDEGEDSANEESTTTCSVEDSVEETTDKETSDENDEDYEVGSGHSSESDTPSMSAQGLRRSTRIKIPVEKFQVKH